MRTLRVKIQSKNKKNGKLFLTKTAKLFKTGTKSRGTIMQKLLPLFGVLSLSAFFRFYNLFDLFHWTLDEEYWAYLPYNIATGYHFPLIGGHISGTGLYSGPLFVWLMSVPIWFIGGNPQGIAIFVALLGVITTALVFAIGLTYFDKKTALLASLLYASSFLAALYDRKYWNATPIPLLTLLVLLAIHKIYQGKLRWAYVLAICLAVAFHSHMTSAVLLLLAFSSWLVLRLPVKEKIIQKALILFFVLQFPFLLFEIRHNFLNSKALLRFLTKPNQSLSLIQSSKEVGNLFINTTSRLAYLPVNLDLADELTLCPQYQQKRYIPPAILGLAIIFTLFLLQREKKKQSLKILLLVLLLNFFSLIWYRSRTGEANWYPGQLSEYLFLPSFPAFFLLMGSSLSKLSHFSRSTKLLLTLLVTTFVLTNLSALITAHHRDGYFSKRIMVDTIADIVKNQPFSLTVKSKDPCRIYGYRYLFSYLKKEPVSSYLDSQLIWLYERRIPSEKAEKQVIITLEKEEMKINVSDFSQE